MVKQTEGKTMKNSKLIKDQSIYFSKNGEMVDGEKVDIEATVRYDDRCGNGHNTFSITGCYYYAGKLHNDRNTIAFGCVHDAISQAFPELRDYIKWHLCSSDGPMHYIANTTYYAEQDNLTAARSSAIWPEAGIDQLRNENTLKDRLPALLGEFMEAVESLGFEY